MIRHTKPADKALSAVMAYLGSIKSKKKAAASRRNGLKNRKAK